MEATFLKSARKRADYPRSDFPRVAFAGRSNVGKSSLINSLVGRKKLAKTSSQPGRTRLINFFQVNSDWVFVDLPGYGYARVSKSERDSWGPMIEEYLTSDQRLKLLVLLVDSRHEPSRLDQVMKQWVEDCRIPYLVVATKADKLSANQLRKSMERMKETLSADRIVPYSTVTGQGRKEVWRIIQED